MLTVFRLVSDGVAGSGWCALSLLACALLRLAVSLLLPGGCRAVLRSFLIPALFCDLCWHAVFYPLGGYTNRGLAAVYVFLLWPALLLLSLLFQQRRSDR